jgi:hypothetical protein
VVKINDSYYVQVEDKNLTLQRINGIDKRTGKPKYSIIGYFSNWPVLFDKLLKLLVADKVNMENTILLSQLKEIYEDVRKEIKALVTDQFQIMV